jgi:hypothetical protein
MSNVELLDCPVCYETKEIKEFFALKCCLNFLCKSCEPHVRETHGDTLPGHHDRFLRCPLCRQMETVPFSLASQLIGGVGNVRGNFAELSFNMIPNFEFTPAQMDQRDGWELRQLILMQQTRRNMEMAHREQRIQQERERLQREEEDREMFLAFVEEMEEAIA